MFQNAELTLREYFDMLRRRRWFIAAVTLTITALAVIPLTVSDPVYASTSEIQLRSETAVSGAIGDEVPENELTRTRNLSTDVAVLDSSEMRALVIERLGPDGPEFDDVFAAVEGFTEIITITVTAPTAAGATEAANAYADVYVETRRESSTDALVAQEDELRSQVQSLQGQLDQLENDLAGITDIVAAESIRQQRNILATQIAQYGARADQLAVNADLREAAYSVVARAPLNTTPIAPKPLRTGVIAFVIGLVVGVCLAVLLEILRDRVETAADLESVDPDLSVLASVPHVNVDLDDPESRLPMHALESFRFLRTAIRFRSLGDGGSAVLITSAASSEGKTTTAVNLASVMAEAGSRVILIDADMRKPAVHERIGVPNRRGLSAVINGECSFQDGLRFVRTNLAVLPAGSPTPQATDLIGDDRFGAMIEAIRDQCDILIIDAPPVLPVADALLAARVVDSSILVGRLGRVRRREVRAAIRQFRDSYLPLMGLLANDGEVGSRYNTYYRDYEAEPDADADEVELVDE